ncbi:hypothetical protein JXA31_01410 [Candidatus Bathyarchaeota archaeon]|nr:hypothetical protein [Candidatus Bathyarchaeota archaeon]
MFGKKTINIVDTKVRNGNTVVFKLSYPRSIKKYLASDYIYAEYSTRIDCVDESILNIPAVASLVPLAWAVGADLSVKKLDKTFVESLNRVKPVFKKWHSNFSFSTRIGVEEVVHNKFSNKGYALLFSGGLDSTVSYIRNKKKKPILIFIRGLDILTKNRALWNNAKAQVLAFSKQEDVKVYFVKSNIRELFYDNLLSVEFGQSWWVRVSHGLTLIGLCAPLSKEGFGTLLIASTRGPQQPGEKRPPLGSSPLIDEKLSWADIKVVHDSYDLNRQQKIKYVLKKYAKNGHHPFLRVCTEGKNSLNCGKCKRCLPTIAGLALEGIDPNKCGLKMDNQTLANLKQSFIDKKYQIFENDVISPNFLYRTDDWKEIQNEIPKGITIDLYNSKEFFEWLRNFDLTSYGNKMERKMQNDRLLKVLKWRLIGCVLSVYYALPKGQQNATKKLLDYGCHKKITTLLGM